MNKKLKAFLMVAEAVAVKSTPGAQAVDSGVRAILHHDVEAGTLDVAEGAIKVIENFKEDDIADEAMFRDGVEDLEHAFSKIKKSLKSSHA